jgi:hypothetical protein
MGSCSHAAPVTVKYHHGPCLAPGCGERVLNEAKRFLYLVAIIIILAVLALVIFSMLRM